MSHFGLGSVTVLKIEVSKALSRMMGSTEPRSYEVDVLTRVCANGSGFRALPGSHSADIADAVSSHLYLIPTVQRGLNGTLFGSVALQPNGTLPQLIHRALLTVAPTMRANQCFVGVATYAVPPALGSPADVTRYSVDLVSSYWIFLSPKSIIWSSL